MFKGLKIHFIYLPTLALLLFAMYRMRLDNTDLTKQLVAARNTLSSYNDGRSHLEKNYAVAIRMVTDTEVQLEQIQSENIRVKHEVEKLNKVVAKLQTRTAAEKTGSSAINSQKDSDVDNTEIAELQTIRGKAIVERRYGRLLKNLALTPDKTAQLTQLLMNKRLVSSDVLASAQASNSLVDDDEVGELIYSAKQEINQQLGALLGETGYSVLAKYEQQLGQTNVLSQIQTTLDTLGSPLTPTQQAMLRQTMDSHSATHLNTKIVSEAEQYLSSAQTKVMQDYLAEHQAASRLRTLANSAVTSSGKTTR